MNEYTDLELWLVGSCVHQKWQPRDIDYIIIGEEKSFLDFIKATNKLKFPLPHSFAFLNHNENIKKPRYIQRNYFLINALREDARLLSKNIYHISPIELSVDELLFARLFHVTVGLYIALKNKQNTLEEESIRIDLMSLNLDSSNANSKNSILNSLSDELKSEVYQLSLISDYKDYVKVRLASVIETELESLSKKDLDLPTILLLKKLFPQWLSEKDINSEVKKFIKSFYG